MKHVVKLMNGKELRSKFTAEERYDGKSIATVWHPDFELEHDRTVHVFETYSMAVAQMYKMALVESLHYGPLEMRES